MTGSAQRSLGWARPKRSSPRELTLTGSLRDGVRYTCAGKLEIALDDGTTRGVEVDWSGLLVPTFEKMAAVGGGVPEKRA